MTNNQIVSVFLNHVPPDSGIIAWSKAEISFSRMTRAPGSLYVQL